MSLGAYNSRGPARRPAGRHFEGIDPSAWAKPAETEAVRFGCPHCGSEDLREANVAYAWLRVTGWSEDGEPTDFDTDAEAEWSSDEDAEHPLRCYGCDKGLRWDDVVRLGVED